MYLQEEEPRAEVVDEHAAVTTAHNRRSNKQVNNKVTTTSIRCFEVQDATHAGFAWYNASRSSMPFSPTHSTAR
jgi:hypothetical protein